MFDAIIIGGGPAGATTGLLLARAGWSVAILERAPFPRRKVCGEFVSATSLPLLDELGLADTFLALAGPEVRRVGLFAGDHRIIADMPPLGGGARSWGRALGREHLDTALLKRAAAEGAEVWQPWSVVGIGDGVCKAVCGKTRDTRELRARVVIAAHGSWDPGQLPSQPERRAARGSDLFGFKAHFRHSTLPAGLMPLLAFPGGYGGLVHSDHGRVSLSCCIRRDVLERCRHTHSSPTAGDAVLAHMKASCAPLRDVLADASLEQEWRSAGPIRPGIRIGVRPHFTFVMGSDPVFRVGNAAGEAHPVVAEGISMAIQAGQLLAVHLSNTRDVAEARRGYVADWQRMFAPRIRAAAVVAHWAMRPAAVALTLPLLRAFPILLTAGARTAGKVQRLTSPLLSPKP